MKAKSLESLLRAVSVICLTTFWLPLFLFVPAIQRNSPKLSAYALPLVLALLGLSAIAFMLSRLIARPNRWIDLPQSMQAPTRPQHPAYFQWLTHFILAVLFGVSVYQLRAPLDWDELDVYSRITSPETAPANGVEYGNLDVISPHKNTRNHALATAASWLATKAFGVSEKSARFPAVVFTFLFLGLISYSIRHFWGKFTSILVLLHLAANQTVGWYLHSMRGYSSMLGTSLALFILIKALSQKAHRAPHSLPLLFSFAFLATLVTHTFGIFFALLVLLSLLIWLFVNQSQLPYHVMSSGRAMLIQGILVSPVGLIILFTLFVFLKSVGVLNAGSPPSLLAAIGEALGIHSDLFSLISAILILALFACRMRSPRKFFNDFPSILLLASGIFVVVLFYGVHPVQFQGRFLLPFVIPLVAWVGETLSWERSGLMRNFGRSVAIVVLVVFPIFGAPAVWRDRTDHMADFNRFAKKMRALLNNEGNFCVSVSGEADQSRFLRDIYFYKEARQELKTCTRIFHAHFARDAKDTPPQSFPLSGKIEKWYDDGKGRELYQIQATPQRFAYVSTLLNR